MPREFNKPKHRKPKSSSNTFGSSKPKNKRNFGEYANDDAYYNKNTESKTPNKQFKRDRSKLKYSSKFEASINDSSESTKPRREKRSKEELDQKIAAYSKPKGARRYGKSRPEDKKAYRSREDFNDREGGYRNDNQDNRGNRNRSKNFGKKRSNDKPRDFAGQDDKFRSRDRERKSTDRDYDGSLDKTEYSRDRRDSDSRSRDREYPSRDTRSRAPRDRGDSYSRGSRPGSRGDKSDRGSRGGRADRNSNSRSSGNRRNKTMDPDYSILVKKAIPQTLEDYKATKSFQDHGLHENIVFSLNKKGYTQPTAIQDQAIPHILDKKDIIGIANTGTGKTAAFLLPLIHQVYDDPTKTILILAPTRELVTQISNELRSFTEGTSIGSTIIIGGVSQVNQVRELQKNKNFIISTTGRGLDLIRQKKLKIEKVDTIVLDEMDQMLDMGFINDIRTILSLAVNKKHLLFFSATISNNVESLAREILNDPILVSVVRGQTADNVNQDVVEIGPRDNKFEKLCEILSRPEVNKAIVFENTKHGSARLEKDLNKNGFKSLAIHGNKNQNQRSKALDAFKSGKIDILIATNVAARGLDIPLVSHVINYSLPQSKDDYIHRIGRTGRAGETGQAYTFVPK